MSVPLLQLHNLTWPQENAPPAFSLELTSAEQVAMVGGSPAQCTALLRRAAGLQRPLAAHQVFFEGRDLARLWFWQWHAVRPRLQYVGGNPQQTLAPLLTVAQAVLEAVQIHRRGTRAEQRARTETLLAHFGLNPYLFDRKTSTLSAALRQRVALARALVLTPRLLIADAVADWLDPAAAVPLLEALTQWCREQHITLLWSTRDPALAQRFADRVLEWPRL